MLRMLDDDLWVCEQEFRSAGLPLQSRMTVVRLPGNRLWLHSPVRPVAALREEVAGLGHVCELVAPNRYHHLFADAWREHFPGAHLHGAPGLQSKRSELTFDTDLGCDASAAWNGEIRQQLVEGAPLLGEVVFLHTRSRTLLMTDLVSCAGGESPWFQRIWMRLNGIHGRLGTGLAVRMLFREKELARRSLARVLEWDFERLIVCHGQVIERNAKASLRRALAWLLD